MPILPAIFHAGRVVPPLHAFFLERALPGDVPDRPGLPGGVLNQEHRYYIPLHPVVAMKLQFLLLACSVLAGGIFASGCSLLYKDPQVTVTSVVPESFSLSEITLNVTLDVNNPNSMGITLKTLSFDVYYQQGSDWVYLSHGEQSGVRINPGENEVSIPVTVNNVELGKSLLSLVSQGTLTLQIRGYAAPDILGFGPKIPFTHTTTISL
jgi:LEA14-like dessication related protein